MLALTGRKFDEVRVRDMDGEGKMLMDVLFSLRLLKTDFKTLVSASESFTTVWYCGRASKLRCEAELRCRLIGAAFRMTTQTLILSLVEQGHSMFSPALRIAG